MKNRLRHVSDRTFAEFIGFATRHPEIIEPWFVLQKLVIYDFVAPHVESHPHGDILEIGCGQGIHSCLLRRAGNVWATDLAVPGSFVGADRDVASAREVIFAELGGNGIRFSANDGRTLPYPDASFDLVFHNSVIEHVPDVDRFQEEVHRVLRPKGVCICVTGTTLLCWFRFLKDSVLKLPWKLAAGIVKEFVPSYGHLGIMERLRRLPFVIDESGGPESLKIGRGMYPRIANYVNNPGYNAVLIEDMAASAGVPVEILLSEVYRHFKDSILRRFLYYLCPLPHGQHYRNVFEEMKRWRPGTWIETFTRAGFRVEAVTGYRYHHLLEINWSYRLDALLYHYMAEFIHRRVDRKAADPAMASEFILVAAKG
jgi:SAM-dependent methyltransferase